MRAVETERLLLRRWSPTDIDELVALFAEPEVWRYPFGRGLSAAEAEQFLERQLEHWTANGFGMWAAVLAGTGRSRRVASSGTFVTLHALYPPRSRKSSKAPGVLESRVEWVSTV